MLYVPRVALFADTFDEINGAANVIRRLVKFAQENNFPFLCVRSGAVTQLTQDGSIQFLELKRSRASLQVDCELRYDPLLWKYKNLVGKTLKEFKPDIVHLTGLNDISQLGFFFAHFLKFPAVASWHTNTHEYAARRFVKMVPWLPCAMRHKINGYVEKSVMRGLMKLYFLAQLQLAPNEELVTEIQRRTRRPARLMSRGVDTKLFAPTKRARTDDKFILGYVGRLRTEKNVRLLSNIDQQLHKFGITNYKFMIVGEGSEHFWLEKNLSQVHLTGVLHGEELAKAYADMDLFVFPSHTDAFGNVVLEAMASGVPAVVMPEGGPKFLMRHAACGYIAQDEHDFVEAVVNFVRHPEQLCEMRQVVRSMAIKHSWEQIFNDLYQSYSKAMTFKKNVRA
ncbi:MAG: glycosyltransferase [Pyrinomonadaceae bacterium]